MPTRLTETSATYLVDGLVLAASTFFAIAFFSLIGDFFSCCCWFILCNCLCRCCRRKNAAGKPSVVVPSAGGGDAGSAAMPSRQPIFPAVGSQASPDAFRQGGSATDAFPTFNSGGGGGFPPQTPAAAPRVRAPTAPPAQLAMLQGAFDRLGVKPKLVGEVTSTAPTTVAAAAGIGLDWDAGTGGNAGVGGGSSSGGGFDHGSPPRGSQAAHQFGTPFVPTPAFVPVPTAKAPFAGGAATPSRGGLPSARPVADAAAYRPSGGAPPTSSTFSRTENSGPPLLPQPGARRSPTNSPGSSARSSNVDSTAFGGFQGAYIPESAAAAAAPVSEAVEELNSPRPALLDPSRDPSPHSQSQSEQQGESYEQVFDGKTYKWEASSQEWLLKE